MNLKELCLNKFWCLFAANSAANLSHTHTHTSSVPQMSGTAPESSLFLLTAAITHTPAWVKSQVCVSILHLCVCEEGV